MKIKVEFSRKVPNDVIEKLMENPECSMDDLGMDRYDDYLMAMSIAAYKKEKKDASMSELCEWAADDIADGIDLYFFEDMVDNYTAYYRERLKGDIRVYYMQAWNWFMMRLILKDFRKQINKLQTKSRCIVRKSRKQARK